VAGDSTLLDRALRSTCSMGLAHVPPSLTYTSPVLPGEYLILPGGRLLSRRSAARALGLAFGLALAVRPAGLAEAPGSRVCACGASDAPKARP
jgi:hypothetical protein